MGPVREERCAGAYHIRALLRYSDREVTTVQTTNHPLGRIPPREQNE
jgi:hypothetical protein